MIKNLFSTLCLLIILWPGNLLAQSKMDRCGAMQHLDRELQEDPGLSQRMSDIERHTQNFQQSFLRSGSAIISIPVVFHVVYRTASENIDDSLLISQIEILNKDFRKMNADTSVIPSVFSSLASDTRIEFVLAKRDPDGNPTTGITRTLTSEVSFTFDDMVKYDISGGKNAWPSDQYLNFWVCNLTGTLLGYAQFPGGDTETDGVVCNYLNVGNNPAAAPYGLGRTATHEVGHWLNLRHIWGDSFCGDDFVDDTPAQETSNSACPVFPHLSSCAGNAPNGDMYVNYMDYSYDQCLVMFTEGQKQRMQATLAPGGPRFAITGSLGGIAPTSCSNPPTPGTAQASSTEVCVGELVSLSLNGASHGTGQNYQWQISTDNTNWNNISNDTGMTALLTISEDSYFRCALTCDDTTVYSSSVEVITESYIINTYPHFENFDLLPLDCGWVIENTNGDSSTWSFLSNPTFSYSGANSLIYTYNPVSAADDWIFVPAAQVDPNKEYRLSFRQRVYGALYPESMEIWVGTAPNSGSMTELLFSNSNLTNNSYILRNSDYYRPSDYGMIYFGIRCNSNADQAYLFIDDLEVQENVVCVPGIASTVATNVDCHGAASAAIDLSISGGVAPYTYLWSNGSTNEDIAAAVAGVYTVTVTDAAGCILIESASVSEPEVLMASPSYTSIKCHNSGTATMRISAWGGTSPYSYSWNTSPVQTTYEVSNVQAGNYEVLVTDDNGCTVTKQVQIKQPKELMIFLLQNFPGPGDINLLLTGGVAPYTFTWSNGATTEDLTGVPPGFYFVNVKDKNSCAKLKFVNLTYSPDKHADISSANALLRTGVQKANAGFSLFPNPAEDVISIVANDEEQAIKSFRIINLLGEVVTRTERVGEDGIRKLEVPVGHLSQGFYFMQIEGRDTETIKFRKF